MIAQAFLSAVDLLLACCCLGAAIPAILTFRNLRHFMPPPEVPSASGPPPTVSVLIPARNEERAIARAVTAALASTDVELEVIVLDDQSEDRTAGVVSAIAAADDRAKLIAGRPLPSGWCGKQHACARLAEAASHEHLVFIDADVTVAPDGIARSIAFLRASRAALASGFPRQSTVSFLDWLLLPLIHFVLLGYLPLERSRRSNAPSMAAGCGQLFVTRRVDYERAGGHAAIRSSLHDGLKLPRAYRRAGLATDIFDATDIATCRMYERDVDVFRGLSKNATEGLASPRTIVPATLLLLLGQVLPVPLAAAAIAFGWPTHSIVSACVAAALSYAPRCVEALRFKQSLAAAMLHPLAVGLFLLIQWYAAVRKALGLGTSWRGRSLAAQS